MMKELEKKIEWLSDQCKGCGMDQERNYSYTPDCKKCRERIRIFNYLDNYQIKNY